MPLYGDGRSGTFSATVTQLGGYKSPASVAAVAQPGSSQRLSQPTSDEVVAGSSSGAISLGGTASASVAAAASGSVALGGTATAVAGSTAAAAITVSGTATPRAVVTSAGTVTLGGAAVLAAPTTAAGTVTLGGSVIAAAGAVPAAYRAGALLNDGVTGAQTTSLPVAIPAAAQVGDIAVAHLITNANDVAEVFTIPAGWTQRTGPDQSGAGAQTSSHVFTRTIAPGDPGSTVTFTHSTSRRMVGTLTVWSGVSESGFVLAGLADGSAGVTADLPTASGVPQGAMVIGLFGRRSAVATTMQSLTVPGNYTGADESRTNIASAGNLLSRVAYRTAPSSGSYGGESASTAADTHTGYDYVLALPATADVGPIPPSSTGGITLGGASSALASATTGGSISLGGVVTARGSATTTGAVTLGGTGTARTTATTSGTVSLAGSASSGLDNFHPHIPATATVTPAAVTATLTGNGAQTATLVPPGSGRFGLGGFGTTPFGGSAVFLGEPTPTTAVLTSSVAGTATVTATPGTAAVTSTPAATATLAEAPVSAELQLV